MEQENKIDVRLTSMSLSVEGMSDNQTLDIGMRLSLPNGFKLYGNPILIEEFLSHCFNVGFETYEPTKQKALESEKKELK